VTATQIGGLATATFDNADDDAVTGLSTTQSKV